MFEQSSLPPAAIGARAYSTTLGFLTQAILITGAALVPVISPDTLPRVRTMIGVFIPPLRREPSPARSPPPTSALCSLSARTCSRPLLFRPSPS